MTIVTLVAAILLALIHLFAGKMHALHGIPRSRWLSAAGGVSIAFVFLHLLPELEEGQEVLGEAVELPLLEHSAYLAALVGLALFYGLERMATLAPTQRGKQSGQEGKRPKQGNEKSEQTRTFDAIFWIHVGSFAIYNLLIGYTLLQRDESSISDTLIFTLALGLHFVANDYSLYDHHEEVYEHRGRWIMAAAILLGWGVGYLIELDEAITSLLTAFVAGGIMLNVLKEELPEERETSFKAFAIGASAYALIMLVSS